MIAFVLALSLARPAVAGDLPGQSTYTAKCQACHGPAGKGDGPAAAALPKPPPDLTAPEFWKDLTDEQLKNAITNGKPGGVMRPFPMQDSQLIELVAFVRTFEPK